LVALAHRCFKPTEDSDVFIVEIHVDVAVKGAVCGKDLILRGWVCFSEIAEHFTDSASVDGYFAFAVRAGAKHRGNSD